MCGYPLHLFSEIIMERNIDVITFYLVLEYSIKIMHFKLLQLSKKETN